ncbi:hypothetical protein ACFLZ2_01800 [Candidatus Margulisiibacteriota bacterium]
MKKIMLCLVIVMLLASPVFAEKVDLSKTVTLSRFDLLHIMFEIQELKLKTDCNLDVNFVVDQGYIVATVKMPSDATDTDKDIVRIQVYLHLDMIANMQRWAMDMPREVIFK